MKVTCRSGNFLDSGSKNFTIWQVVVVLNTYTNYQEK